MKIYSLLLVKNEADIISTSLLSACRWSDKIIVIDNGSTDGTWEIIQRLALSHPQIIPFLRYTGPFHIGLRAKAFRAFRHELTTSDWWCVRLDADELYDTDVRTFLSQVPPLYSNIKKSSTDYILTKEDILTLPLNSDFTHDRPLITHFLPNRRRERRFVRHSPFLFWSERWRYPHPLGLTYPTPIPVQHYQYRSPQQMQKRFSTRQQAKADGCGSFKHEQGTNWQDYLLTNKQLSEQFLLSNLEAEFQASNHIIQQGRNCLKLIDDLVVKQFPTPNFINQFAYRFIRKSKARRSYEYALLLHDHTPQPLMYKEITRFGLLKQSYYVSRLSDKPYTFRQLSHDPAFPNRELILKSVAVFTAQLHRQGILHKDYSGGNILFDLQGNIHLVDLNRLAFRRKISVRTGCRNFSRLVLTDSDIQIIAHYYAAAMNFNYQQTLQLITYYNHKYHHR